MIALMEGAQQIITVQDMGMIEKVTAFLKVYLWEVIACVIAPLLATRFTNVIKAIKRIVIKAPFPPVIWHILTWTLAFGMSYYALQFKYPNSTEELLFISLILASFNTAIVEYMHRKAKLNDERNAIFNKIIYMDEDEIDTFTRIGALASGMRVMVDKRKQPRDEHEAAITRKLTETEISEITDEKK